MPCSLTILMELEVDAGLSDMLSGKFEQIIQWRAAARVTITCGWPKICGNVCGPCVTWPRVDGRAEPCRPLTPSPYSSVYDLDDRALTAADTPNPAFIVSCVQLSPPYLVDKDVF